MRQRKQRDVAKENEFYLQLMQQALPADTAAETVEQQQQQPETTSAVSSNIIQHNNNNASKIQQPTQQQQSNRQSHEKNGHVMNGVTSLPNGVSHSSKSHRKSMEKSKEHVEHEHR